MSLRRFCFHLTVASGDRRCHRLGCRWSLMFEEPVVAVRPTRMAGTVLSIWVRFRLLSHIASAAPADRSIRRAAGLISTATAMLILPISVPSRCPTRSSGNPWLVSSRRCLRRIRAKGAACCAPLHMPYIKLNITLALRPQSWSDRAKPLSFLPTGSQGRRQERDDRHSGAGCDQRNAGQCAGTGGIRGIERTLTESPNDRS